jgi:chromatin-remodeling ATPase INO80
MPPPPPPMPIYPLIAPADNRHPAMHERTPSVMSVDDYDSQLDPDEWDRSSRHRPRPRDDFNSAEDAARALEDFALGRGGPSAGSKRPAAGAYSDSGSDLEVPVRKSHAHKRRRLGGGEEIAAEFERAADEMGAFDASFAAGSTPSISAIGKGKGRHLPADQRSVDSAPSTPMGGRGKKTKKTLPPHTQDGLMEASVSVAASRGVTPSASGPASPALTASTLLELDDPIPAMKKARKADHATMMKRVKALEESQRKVWLSIARKDVVKVCSV